MTKLTIDDLVGDMPEEMIVQSLDDDRDGLANGTEAIDATSDGAVIAKPAKIYNTLGVMS